ncbi:MAG: acyl carrier protein [Candidatus Aminicenantes bacterium]|nr:acyl carrier protein [Candidatus Omnitrophota bacterium]NPV83992.1 acyl carrier protein [Candidatus Aminicenantes bacterium]
MNTKEKIKHFFIKELMHEDDLSKINDTDSLIESGLIDSHAIMSLIAFLEDEFKIRIEPQDLLPENFDNINAISSLVDRILNTRK